MSRGRISLVFLEPDCGDVHSVSQILEYTFARFLQQVVQSRQWGGEEQLYNKFSVFFDPAGVSVDHHAVSWHFGTGSKKSFLCRLLRYTGDRLPKVDTSE